MRRETRPYHRLSREIKSHCGRWVTLFVLAVLTGIVVLGTAVFSRRKSGANAVSTVRSDSVVLSELTADFLTLYVRPDLSRLKSLLTNSGANYLGKSNLRLKDAAREINRDCTTGVVSNIRLLEPVRLEIQADTTATVEVKYQRDIRLVGPKDVSDTIRRRIVWKRGADRQWRVIRVEEMPVPLNMVAPGKSSSATESSSSVLDRLGRVLADELQKRSGKYAVAVYDFASGDSLLVNGHRVFRGASLVKLPIMMVAFALADQGKISLETKLKITTTFKSAVDSSPFTVSPIASLPDEATIRRLIQAMITVSDNVATNVLLKYLTVSRIRQFLNRSGYRETNVKHYMMDEKAFRRGIDNNALSAYNVMCMLRDIESAHGFRRESADEMLRILKQQTHNEKIPAGLPPSTQVAHKTGRIVNLEHDAGIVYLPNRKFILVFLSEDLPGNQAGIDAAIKVTKTIYAELSGTHAAPAKVRHKANVKKRLKVRS